MKPMTNEKLISMFLLDKENSEAYNDFLVSEKDQEVIATKIFTQYVHNWASSIGLEQASAKQLVDFVIYQKNL